MGLLVDVRRGFSHVQREQVASLYDTAFGQKLGIGIPDAGKRQRLLAEVIDPIFAFVAVVDGAIVGIAGIRTSTGGFVGAMGFHVLLRHLGFWGALRAALMFTILSRPMANGQLLMEGLAVREGLRGNGIGSRLLSAVVDQAKADGFRAIRLDVVDSNLSARRLYERLGFIEKRTERFEYLRWLIGFGSATRMEFEVGPPVTITDA